MLGTRGANGWLLGAPRTLFSSKIVGVYWQACSGIPLAVRFIDRNRRLWNLMVQGKQRFRQVRAASCVIPYVLCGLYCLRCWWLFGEGPCPPLYIRGDRVTWKVLTCSWSPTTTQSGSFFCTAASSMPIRVVTKEVRYIHELPYSRTFYV